MGTYYMQGVYCTVVLRSHGKVQTPFTLSDLKPHQLVESEAVIRSIVFVVMVGPAVESSDGADPLITNNPD